MLKFAFNIKQFNLLLSLTKQQLDLDQMESYLGKLSISIFFSSSM